MADAAERSATARRRSWRLLRPRQAPVLACGPPADRSSRLRLAYAVQRHRGAHAANVSAPTPPAEQTAQSNLGRGAVRAALPHDETRRSRPAALGRLWSNPWFGRRDLIPPASDARTLLIDRAMVGPRPDHARGAGRDPQDRRADGPRAARPGDGRGRWPTRPWPARRKSGERIKEQKKAEAAERKRRHAEAVAQRKRPTSSSWAAASRAGWPTGGRTSRSSQRRACRSWPRRPTSPRRWAFSIPRLRWLAFHNEPPTRVHYVRFTVPKKIGRHARAGRPAPQPGRGQRGS